MKRLALTLAAAVLGTGCIAVVDDHENTCFPSATVDWSFRNADGGVTSSCNAAGVTWVDVWANGALVGEFDCFGPAGTVALARGANLVTVEGLDAPFDAGGAVLYRDEFTVDAAACGHQGTFAAVPAEGRVNLDYATTSAPPCAGGPCYVWFAVHDDIANETAWVANAQFAPTSYPYPNDIVARLPAGSYTVHWMQVVSGGFMERQACAAVGFDVAAGNPGLAPGQQQVVPFAGPVSLKATCP
jgi:hypothetical protein